MREIRAWDKIYKKFKRVKSIEFDPGYVRFDNDDLSELDGVVIIEYIGQKDKNGVEIYEETLLKDPQGNIGRVFYSEKSAAYLVNWHRKDDGPYETDACFGYGEVVGTTFENPELWPGSAS